MENDIDGGPDAGAYTQTSGGAGYKHQHVLRRSSTDANFWGELLNTSAVTADKEISKTYDLYIDPSWNADNIYVAAVIWRQNISGNPVNFMYVNGKDNR